MSQDCPCQIVRDNLLGDYQERIAYCALHQVAPALAEVLKKAIALITAEYCSHPEPHSPMLYTCYAQDQLKVLAQAEG